MSDTIVIKLTADSINPVKAWFLSRKRLPKPEIVNLGAEVSDGDWQVGDTYATKDGRTVKVLQKNLVFMGFSALVQYSNGALRWNGYHDRLYRIES